MLARLAERGYLHGPLREAFDRVDRSRFLPSRYRAHALLDCPLPLGDAGGGIAGYSPRACALLLMAADVRPGDRVLLHVPDNGYLAALAAEIAGPTGRVVLATGHGALAAAAARRLRAAGYPATRVSVVAQPAFTPRGWDRVLLAEEAGTVPVTARHALAELGTLVTRVPREERIEIVRTVRTGGEQAEILLGDLSPAPRPLGPGVEEAWPLRRMLALEEALRRVWTSEGGSAEEAEFTRAIGETWKPRANAAAGNLDAAKSFFHLGYVYLMAGDLEAAEDCYRASITAAPTAEGFTFLGWTWSFSGRFEDAIDACRRAVAIDPRFGNAYNDIGAYLIELGKPDEAVPWLERAMKAPRYAAKAYPYTNLARARLVGGDVDGAKAALATALEIDPDYEPARRLLDRLGGDDESPTDDGDEGGAEAE